MRLNVFAAKSSIASCMDRPDLRLAFILTLIPAILSAIGQWYIGFPFRISETAVALARSVIMWLLLSAVAYIVLYLVRGKDLQGKIMGIASSLSLLWILSSILTLIGFGFFFFVFSPEIVNEAKLLATGQSTVDEFAGNVGSILNSNPQAIDTTLGTVAIILATLIFLFALYFLYRLVSECYPGGFFRKATVSLVLLAAWVYLAHWILFFL